MGSSALRVGPDLSLPKPTPLGTVGALLATGGVNTSGVSGQTAGLSIGMDTSNRGWITANDPNSSIHVLAGTSSIGIFLDSQTVIAVNLILAYLSGSPSVAAGAADSGGAGFRMLRVTN